MDTPLHSPIASSPSPAPAPDLCASCGGACCRYITIPLANLIGWTNRALPWFEARGTVDAEGRWRIYSPCRHLTPEGRCGIYATRPEVCRDYPVDGPSCRAARAAFQAAAPAAAASWLPIETAPKGDTEILILFDSATVPVVRLCWWNDGSAEANGGDPDPVSVGWWSYRYSVTQEKMEPWMRAVAWMPMPSWGRPNTQISNSGRKSTE